MNPLIVAALALTLLVAPKQAEKLGDAYQIALPVIGLGCAVVNGQAADYALRYAVQWSVVQGSKSALGEAEINRRPNGNWRGMPSGHTATAVFGASYLVHECVTANPWVKGVVLLSAGFVGASRIEARAHDIWQVMIGALVGWLGDRAFRRRAPRDWLWRLWRLWRRRRAPAE